jgi:hypothetical protein
LGNLNQEPQTKDSLNQEKINNSAGGDLDKERAEYRNQLLQYLKERAREKWTLK